MSVSSETAGNRRRLGTLATGLIVYGLVGIVLTVVLLGGELVLTARMETLTGQVTAQLATTSATIDKTAAALDAAAQSSNSFAVTIEQAGPTLHQVDATLTTLGPALRQIQSTLGAVSLLGSTPFAGATDRLGALATQIEGLEGQIGTLAGNLDANKTSLSTLGGSLSGLAEQLRQTNATLGSGVIEQGLADLIGILRIAITLLAIWFAVPAVGALLFGIWLRRQLKAG